MDASDDQAWSEIEEFVARVARLSQAPASTVEFLRQVLGETIQFLAAAGGAIWLQDQPDQFRLQCESNIQLLATGHGSEMADAHQQFLHRVIRSAEPQTLPPSPNSGLNRSQYCWLAAPFSVDGRVAGILEILQDPHPSEALQAGHARLLSMVCELIGDFLQLLQVQQLQAAEQRWLRYAQLVRLTQCATHAREIAYHLVNEGQALIGCDRLSLLELHGERPRLLATSGVDSIERRSQVATSMETLVQAVVRTGQPLRFRGEGERLAPQLESAVDDYLEASHTCQCDVLPLWASSASDTPGSGAESVCVGALLIDQFAATGDALDSKGISQVVDLAGPCLRRAQLYAAWPIPSLVRIRQSAATFGRSRRRWIIAALCLAVTGLALLLLPVPHRIRAVGELRPTIQREVYAPLDGEIVEVHSQHDTDVEEGQILLVLRSRPLELELLRLQGEFQTADKRLFAIRSSRVQAEDAFRPEEFAAGQLAAEEQELRQHLASLEQQIELLRQQRELLTIRSPIAGRVLTWDAAEQLKDRPVQRGQLLLTTADLTGPWELELSVPEHRVGYLLNALREPTASVPVRFMLSNDRSQYFSGQLVRLALRTELQASAQAMVPAIASVESGALERLRPGTTVFAKLECGTRPLGFVWFHEVYEKVKGWLLF